MLAASPTTVVKSIAALSRAPSPELQRNVLATIAELEEQAATETPLSPQGRWSLLFSTQVALPDSAAERPSSMAIVQPLIDATYGLFFKVAPQLAGAQQYGGTSLGSNEQIVSIEGASGKVENREEEDGWTGEPSAWADAESVPQRLSELTQRYLGGFKQFVAEQVAGDFDVDAADGQLDDVIGSAPVAIFSFTSCPFCKQAKELLDAKGVAYRAFELDEDALGAGMRARLGKRTGRTSVPSIWIGGECVGGLNDGNPGLVPLEERGELDAKLRAAGVLR